MIIWLYNLFLKSNFFGNLLNFSTLSINLQTFVAIGQEFIDAYYSISSKNFVDAALSASMNETRNQI
jgi:hypothetical protein